MHESSLLTSEPLAPVPVDLDPALDRLSVDNRATFDEIVASVDSRFSPENFSDEEIMELVSRKTYFYINLFEEDTVKAFQYLGVYPDELQTLDTGPSSNEEPKQENPYYREPPANSAFGKFYNSIKSELSAVGATEEEIEQSTQKLIGEYDEFSKSLASDLEEKLDRFKFVVSTFGTPDVLRAEAADASLAYLEELCTKIENTGDRPNRDTLAQRIGATLNLRGTMSQAEFDSYVAKKLAKFKDRDPSELLDDYIKNAMLYYAKVIYGKTPHVADRGFESDPAYLYDSFESVNINPNHNRPLLPEDIVTSAVDNKITSMLFEDSAWSDRFRSHSRRDTWREEERKSRERIFNSGAHSRDYETTHARTSPEPAKKIDQVEQAIMKLNPAKRRTMIEFSQLIGSVPDRNMSHIFRALIKSLKIDFIDRLAKADTDDVDSKSIIRMAMTELHPDRNHLDIKSEQLFKFYGLLRDIAK